MPSPVNVIALGRSPTPEVKGFIAAARPSAAVAENSEALAQLQALLAGAGSPDAVSVPPAGEAPAHDGGRDDTAEASPAGEALAGPAEAEAWLVQMQAQRTVVVATGETAAPAGGLAAGLAALNKAPAGRGEALTTAPAMPAFNATVLPATAKSPMASVEALTTAPAMPVLNASALPATATGPVASVAAMAAPGLESLSLAVADDRLFAALPAVAGQPAAEPASPTSPASPAAGGAPAETLLRLQAPEARWGEQMMQALRDQVSTQLKQNQQQTTIRLDPAELGRLEIQVSHEAGRVSVQINASQADVARLLVQTSDRLRQELVSQHFVQVNVQVGADSGAGGHRAPRQAPVSAEEPVSAAQGEQDSNDTGTARTRRDVLITV